MAGRAAAPASADFAFDVRYLRRVLRRWAAVGRGGGARRRPRARRRPALQSRDRARRGLPARPSTIRVPTSIDLRVCSGTGAKPGSKPRQCRPAAAAAGARQPGLLHGRADLPDLQGPRRDDRRSLHRLRRRGPRDPERTLSVNIPAGIEDGTRIRLAGEGEAGCAAARRAISTSSSRSSRTPVLPARRRRPLLPRADLDDDGGARRRVRGADPRTAQPAGAGAGGHPDRKAVPPEGQGHAGAALAPSGRLYIQVLVETPQKLTAGSASC
jgi:molecular chaperone DnaJ